MDTSTTKLLYGMKNMEKQAKEQISQASEEREETKGSEKSDYKQPRPRPDNWPEQTQKARKKQVELGETWKQRDTLLRQNKPVTKQDYFLKQGVADLRHSLNSLKELTEFYNELMSHTSTDYSLVFAKNKNMTKD